MRHLPLSLVAFVLLTRLASAQTAPPPTKPPANAPANNVADLQTSLDRLTQNNKDLLDLLKKQQAVLEDIQFDRRLQSRQIISIQQRLEETLLQNSQLQNKVNNLEAAAITNQVNASIAKANTPNTPTAPTPPPAPVEPPPPPPPSTYLPPVEEIGAPGTKSWHRLFTLSGTENKNSDLFRIEGKTWRILWHNLDKPGKAYVNTSALFVNAFPKDDSIPQKVCSKLGTGGDGTELNGPGTYCVKVEASGGSWELAVEDFR